MAGDMHVSPIFASNSFYSTLCFMAGSSSSPNFHNSSAPREAASVYVDYLRSHFSISHSKAVLSRASGYLSKLRRATCPEEFRSLSCSLFTNTEFLSAATNFSSFNAIGTDNVAYSMLKHLLPSIMNFLLHMINLS